MIRKLLTVLFLISSAFAGEVLVRRGPADTCRYLDAAAAPDGKWSKPGFDDKAWKIGPGPLVLPNLRLSKAGFLYSWKLMLSDCHYHFRHE